MPKEENLREAVILGALLHDIGKFIQRAQENPTLQNHCQWGFEWFQRKNGLRERPRLSSIFEEKDLAFIDSSIASHHDGVEYITTADALSAGMERINLEQEEKYPFARRLMSIFGYLDSAFPGYHQIKYLGEDNLKETFPISESTVNKEEIKKLLNNFNMEIKQLDFSENTPQDVIVTVYFLLQKYTWCLPSASYKDEPSVSLFEHLKTTAAIADCLYEIKRKGLPDEDNFMLVCGDISGIQKFIYKISSKGAARLLKGRSYYLELLTETIAKYFLREKRYSLVNLLFSGGGRFYILLDSECEKFIEEKTNEINKVLLDYYNGEIYLALGISKFSKVGFQRGNFIQKWREATQDANQRKGSKYKNLLNEHYKKIIGPFGDFGEIEACEVCKKECKETDLVILRRNEEATKVCPFCKQLYDLGSYIPFNRYLIEVYRERKNSKYKGVNFDFLNTKYYFSNKPTFYKELNGEEITVYSYLIEDLKVKIENPLIWEEINVGWGFKFIGGNFAPCDSNKDKKQREILTFDELAEKSRGIKRLGILRMDVDNLGEVFKKMGGSIAQVIQLSWILNLFFGGYINILCTEEEYKDKVYIIYSGGDDVFIVGCWDKVVDLGRDIYSKFRVYTSHALTLSSGISLVPQKYPIYKGAELAKIEEDRAKDYHLNNNCEKNAISFLGAVINWEDFAIGKFMVKELEEIVRERSKGIIEKLKRIYLLYLKGKQMLEKKDLTPLEIEKALKYDRWRWRMTYFLEKSAREDESLRKKLQEIQNALINNEYKGKKSKESVIKYLNLISRWAEFLTREEV